MVFLRFAGCGYRMRARREKRAFEAWGQGGVVKSRVVSALNLGAQMVDLMNEHLVLHADEQQRQAKGEEGANHGAPEA